MLTESNAKIAGSGRAGDLRGTGRPALVWSSAKREESKRPKPHSSTAKPRHPQLCIDSGGFEYARSSTSAALPRQLGDLANNTGSASTWSRSGVGEPRNALPKVEICKSGCARPLKNVEGSVCKGSKAGRVGPECAGDLTSSGGPKVARSGDDGGGSGRLHPKAEAAELVRPELRGGEAESACTESGAEADGPERAKLRGKGGGSECVKSNDETGNPRRVKEKTGEAKPDRFVLRDNMLEPGIRKSKADRDKSNLA